MVCNLSYGIRFKIETIDARLISKTHMDSIELVEWHLPAIGPGGNHVIVLLQDNGKI